MKLSLGKDGHPIEIPMIARVIMIVLVVAGFACLAAGDWISSDLESQAATTEQAAAVSEKSSASVQASTSDADLSDDDMSDIVDAAKTAGQQLADYQNAYYAVDSSDSNAIQVIAEKADALLGDDDKAARSPWFMVGDARWTFYGPYDASTDGLSMLWLCRNDEGIAAYATGTYDAQTQKIVNLSCEVTSLGSSYQYTDEGNESEVDEIRDMSEEIRSYVDSTPDVTPISEEDANAIAEAREEARAQAMEDANNE